MNNPLSNFLPADQADLILIMLFIIPISFGLSFVRNKYIYLLITIAFTLTFQSYLFPTEKWYLWIQQQIVYLIIILAPRKIVGHIVLIESFLALFALQLRRLYLFYGQNPFDITGIFMMQLFNYIGLGYNYQNGLKKQEELTKEQLERRVTSKPSYLTYLGYVNFLPASLVGPIYQYSDFDDYLHRRKDYQNIPSTIPPMAKQLLHFLIVVILYSITGYFDIDKIQTPQFQQFWLPFRFVFMVLCMFRIQFKYIAAWSLGMVSMRASGITYNPKLNFRKDACSMPVYNFSKIEVNNMQKIYLQPTMKVKTDYWNISVQRALRRYIYQNLYSPLSNKNQKNQKSKQERAQMITVIVSALWHGLYPGYFVFFLHCMLFIQISQYIYRLRTSLQTNLIKQFYQKYTFLYNLIQNIAATFTVTYFGVAFMMMTFTRVWHYIELSLYIPYVILYISFILIVKLKVLGKPKRQQKPQTSKQQKKQ